MASVVAPHSNVSLNPMRFGTNLENPITICSYPTILFFFFALVSFYFSSAGELVCVCVVLGLFGAKLFQFQVESKMLNH